MICTFFGHRDCPSEMKSKIKEAIRRAIVDGCSKFLVGNNGNFDFYVQEILEEFQAEYQQIEFQIVLAYMPTKKTRFVTDMSKTILPEECVDIIPKFAISYRNKWLVNQADYVIAYCAHTFGGAYKFLTYAQKKNKKCVNIANLQQE